MKSENSYITKQEDLNCLIDLIKKIKLIAVDTEFTRRTTYYPILSIIQVGLKENSAKKSFIIDCLAGLNLSEFFAIMADAKITKIFHSSMQDLQIFYHESSLTPQGIMDTQIMANFCGFDFNTGYSALVEKLFETKLNKKEQNSDWQRRPLSKKQIDYAYLDVVFLEEIHDEFCKIMSEKKYFEWCAEETTDFIKKVLFRCDDNLSKKFSFRNRNQKQISQLKNLILWREQQARRVNVPRQHFLTDEDLDRIVVDGIDGLRMEQKILDEIMEVLDCETEAVEKRKNFPMTDLQKSLYNKAKKLISEIAEKENFKEQFLITSSALERIISQQKPSSEVLAGWRYKVLGDELEKLMEQPIES